MTPSKNSSFQICTVCKLWHLQCGHIRFLNVLFLKHTFRKCLLTKRVLKKQIMLHIRRALCTFSDGLCICRVWPIILPQPPLKPQVHYLRQQTLIIHGYKLTDTCHEHNTAKESYRNTNHNNSCWCHTVDTHWILPKCLLHLSFYLSPPPTTSLNCRLTKHTLLTAREVSH